MAKIQLLRESSPVIAPPAAYVRHRIDAEGRMIEQDRAPSEAYHHARQAGDHKAKNREDAGRDELVLMKPSQLWKSGEVADLC